MTSVSESITEHQEYDYKLKAVLKQCGYVNSKKLCNTLQGSVWRSMKASTNERVVVKITNKKLHQQSVALVNGKKITVHENIGSEKRILKLLTSDTKDAPKSIVKYHALFKSKINYYLIMEDGGTSLFDFVVKAHKLIENKTLEICEWHKLVKIIFKQMIECIEYIHSKNVCHFDISLENFLINDVNVIHDPNTHKIRFLCDDVQIKLCDFGLAEKFDDRDRFLSNKYCGKPNYKSPEVVNKKKLFDAKSNDVWCLGVCLFMMIVGSVPWNKANEDDVLFCYIMSNGVVDVLEGWNRLNYVTKDLVLLFSSFFKFEDERISVKQIENCSWLK